MSLHSSMASFSLLGLAYLVLRSIYRLYFHPLRHIPGPRLAAISSLYEFYYDVVCQGRYLWEIERLHAIYGTTGCLPAFDLLSCPES